jgi:hypothetical protein
VRYRSGNLKRDSLLERTHGHRRDIVILEVTWAVRHGQTYPIA